MTKDEVLKLALDALGDLGMKHYESTGEVLYKETFTAIKEALAQPEHDYKDLYEKEKRKSAMWLSKYEEVAGPAPKAIPMAQPEQEPVACKECHLKDTVYDLLGDLKVANLKLSVRAQRTWVELTMDDFTDILKSANGLEVWELFKAVETKAREKNNG